MNSGYLSLLFIVISLILFVSGWKDVLVRGITTKVILLFFVSWLIGMETAAIFPLGRIGLWVFVLLAMIVAVIYRSEGILFKMHVLSVGVLLGSISFFLLETIHLIPSMILVSTEISMAIVIGLLASAMFKDTAVQLAAVSIGLLLGETFFRFVHRDHISFQLGSANLQDRWWLTVYTTRGISLLVACMILISKKSFDWLSSSIRRQRNNGE
jgi:hypothetical protein